MAPLVSSRVFAGGFRNAGVVIVSIQRNRAIARTNTGTRALQFSLGRRVGGWCGPGLRREREKGTNTSLLADYVMWNAGNAGEDR